MVRNIFSRPFALGAIVVVNVW